MSVIGVQRRMRELGRVRLGDKGPKGEPRKRDTFRFTTASKTLADMVAAKHGGTVTPWADAPSEGYWQVDSEAVEIDIILPPVFDDQDGHPTVPYSQFYELWSGGGCQRRCDGVTESLTGKPCMCNPDERTCKITTRVSFMLVDRQARDDGGDNVQFLGFGVWRLESHGWNAAIELPGMLETLQFAASQRQFIPAVLRIEQRTKKVPGEGTRRFIVPVIDLPQMTVALDSGGMPLAINAPAPAPPRPALPAGVAPLPDDPQFQHDEDNAPFPEPAPLPDLAALTRERVERLAVLALELGVEEKTAAAVKKAGAEKDADGFLTWLDAQITRAEQALAGRADNGEPPSSYAEKAARAQARKAARS